MRSWIRTALVIGALGCTEPEGVDWKGADFRATIDPAGVVFAPDVGPVWSWHLAAFVADDDYHTHQLATLGAFEPTEDESGTTVSMRFDDVPARGQTQTIELDPSDLPARGSTQVADLASRTATVDLADGWACDGRPANHLGITVTGGLSDRSFDWRIRVPFAEELPVVQLAPELSDAVDTQTLNVVISSVEGGYAGLRTSPMVWGATWIGSVPIPRAIGCASSNEA